MEWCDYKSVCTSDFRLPHLPAQRRTDCRYHGIDPDNDDFELKFEFDRYIFFSGRGWRVWW